MTMNKLSEKNEQGRTGRYQKYPSASKRSPNEDMDHTNAKEVRLYIFRKRELEGSESRKSRRRRNGVTFLVRKIEECFLR